MQKRTRFLFLLLILAVQSLYFPINRLMNHGVTVSFRIDDQIILWPIWAIPYLLGLLWWFGSFIWAAVKMDEHLYKRFVAAVLFVMISSYFVYLFFPTYVVRPNLDGTGWAMEIVRFIYSNDRVYNALPSGHTYTSVLIMLFWWKWFPKKWWLWLGICLIVVTSTLFTKQHYIPDLLGGIIFAGIGYFFSIRIIKSTDT